MPSLCPRCRPLDVRFRNRGGLNYCEKCGSLFFERPERSVPLWVLGVLMILAVHCWLVMR